MANSVPDKLQLKMIFHKYRNRLTKRENVLQSDLKYDEAIRYALSLRTH